MDEFHAYELIDPRNGLVFYVGSGSEIRILTSGTVSHSLTQAKKLAVIKEILAARKKPIPRKVSSHATREQAQEAEERRIEYWTLVHGLELTNKRRRCAFVPEGGKEYCVYEIIDPLLDRVFHVGVTYRFRIECRAVLKGLSDKKTAYIKDLKSINKRPIIRIVGAFSSWIEAVHQRGIRRAELAHEFLQLEKNHSTPTPVLPGGARGVLKRKQLRLSRKEFQQLNESREMLKAIKASRAEKRKAATKKAQETIERQKSPVLESWCGEATDYLKPCRFLPDFSKIPPMRLHRNPEPYVEKWRES